MNKWIAEFELEDGDTMPEHMDLNYMGANIDFHCRPMWIPVSERLPKPYEQVLRTVKSIGWNGTFHIHVDVGSICPIDTDVIAWMPLPKPYESQESEE